MPRLSLQQQAKKKEYDEISEYNKLKWDSLAINPSIFALERWHTGSSPK